MTVTTPTIYAPVAWQDHLAALNWKKGDHLMIAAPTNAGKTTMAATLVEKRSHVVMFVTKLHDDTFKREFPARRGWTRFYDWPPNGPKSWQTKILLWPEQQPTMRQTLVHMRGIFARALEWLYRKGGYCIVIDESLMFTDPKFLGFGSEVGMLHYHGRSSGITMVTLTQRPAWIPKIIYSSITHAYIAKIKDKDDARRLSDLGGIDAKEVVENLHRLPSRHDYIYLNPLGDAIPCVVNTRR